MANDVKFTLTAMTDDDIIAQAQGKQVLNAENYLLRGDPKPISGGLFDPAIFGKIKSCTCGFKRAKTKTDPPVRCPYCKTVVFSNEEDYMRNSAFFRLHAPVLFPYKITKFWDLLKRWSLAPIKVEGQSSSQWHNKLALLWDMEYHVSPATDDEDYQLLDSSGKKYKLTIQEVNDDTQYSDIGLIGLYNLQKYTLSSGEILDFKQYLNTCIPVTSTYFRHSPLVKRSGSYTLQLDNQSILYAAIIEMSKLMGGYIVDFLSSPIDIATALHNMNFMVCQQMNSIELLRGGKYHTIRENMRQRVKRSGRANIYPALDLDMDHVYIPRSLAYTALNGDIIDKLAETMGYEDARKEYDNVGTEATRVFQEINDQSMVLLLRPPTLHKMNLMAFHPVLSDEPAIGIPVDVCTPFNADFDGDQMSFYYITDPYMCARVANDMSPHQIWYYEKTQNPVYVPTHEILFGLYYATKPGKLRKGKEFGTFEQMEQAYEQGKIEFDDIVLCSDKQTTYGRSKIENILGGMELSAILDNPDKGEVMVPISSGNIGKIVAGIGAKKDRATIIKNLNNFAVEIITHQGMDTPPFDKVFDYDDPELKKIMNSHDPVSIKYTHLNNYIQNKVLTDLKKLPMMSDMLKGSGRVKPTQLTEIYAPPIYGNGEVDLSNSNLFEGLTERDFVNKAIENRQVQQVKSFSVPIGGFSSRQLVLSQMDLKFVDKEESPDKIGLKIPRREALGRTTLDGRKIRSVSPLNSKELVTVKSCINHNKNVVYADEIDQEHLQEKDGSAIGISFAMSFTEAKTQGALALKHR